MRQIFLKSESPTLTCFFFGNHTGILVPSHFPVLKQPDFEKPYLNEPMHVLQPPSLK